MLTRSGNRERIEAELARHPVEGLHVAYHDVPLPPKRVGWQAHYLWWQFTAMRTARPLFERVGFDVLHHVSYVRYWTPSLLAALPAPFVWGPVGGAEATRLDLDLGAYGRAFELFRRTVLGVADWTPLVPATARRSAVALAASEGTARRLRRLGVRDVRRMSPVGAPTDALDRGRALEAEGPRTSERPTFLSVTGANRLVHWKGVQLGIRAFAAARLDDGEYHVFGSGRQLPRLQRLARELGVAEKVRFWGDVSRVEMLDVMERSHALVHPGIHDPGATVIPEAMALGVPVLCLDAGGPAVMVDDATGVRAPFGPRSAAVSGLADGMVRLSREPGVLASMRAACFVKARGEFSWSARAQRYLAIYDEVAVSRRQEPSVALAAERG